MDTVTDRPTEAKTRSLGTVRDVGKRLSSPPSTVYELARANRIPGVVRIGRAIRFDLEKVEAWIEQGGEVRHAA